jgi:hypothetical protein
VDVQGRVERSPYAMMAGAVGCGYVLGGGLFSPLSARIAELGLRVGVRLVAIPLVQRRLLGFAEAAMACGAGADHADSRTCDTTTSNEKETMK